MASALEAPEEVRAAPRCPHCGEMASKDLSRCLQSLPKTRIKEGTPAEKGGQIRRGLLYMLLAAVIHYFAGGYSPMDLSFPVNPVVTLCLTPLLFLSGLGLSLYGLYLLTLGW